MKNNNLDKNHNPEKEFTNNHLLYYRKPKKFTNCNKLHVLYVATSLQTTNLQKIRSKSSTVLYATTNPKTTKKVYKHSEQCFSSCVCCNSS